jgi:hypothetical protein
VLGKVCGPPACADGVQKAWREFILYRAPPGLSADLDDTTFYDGAKIERRLPWRGVCAKKLFDSDVWQVYQLDADGCHQVDRKRHDSKLARVETAPLVKPLAIFTAGGSGNVGYVLCHSYSDYVETPRGADFMFFKPRVLDTANMRVIPLCEFARPLWGLPYYKDPEPAIDGPVPDARKIVPAPLTALVSTYIDWLG